MRKIMFVVVLMTIVLLTIGCQRGHVSSRKSQEKSATPSSDKKSSGKKVILDADIVGIFDTGKGFCFITISYEELCGMGRDFSAIPEILLSRAEKWQTKFPQKKIISIAPLNQYMRTVSATTTTGIFICYEFSDTTSSQ